MTERPLEIVTKSMKKSLQNMLCTLTTFIMQTNREWNSLPSSVFPKSIIEETFEVKYVLRYVPNMQDIFNFFGKVGLCTLGYLLTLYHCFANNFQASKVDALIVSLIIS